MRGKLSANMSKHGHDPDLTVQLLETSDELRLIPAATFSYPYPMEPLFKTCWQVGRSWLLVGSFIYGPVLRGLYRLLQRLYKVFSMDGRMWGAFYFPWKHVAVSKPTRPHHQKRISGTASVGLKPPGGTKIVINKILWPLVYLKSNKNITLRLRV